MVSKANNKDLIIAEIRYLENIALKYIDSIGVLNLEKNSDHFYAVNLLTVQSLELLIKSIIANRILYKFKALEQNDISKIIDCELRKFGHNLKKLLEAIKDLWDDLEIISIKRVGDAKKYKFVDQYEICLRDKSKVYIKSIEASRYGPFASKKDYVSNFSSKNINLLKKLSKQSKKISLDVFNKL